MNCPKCGTYLLFKNKRCDKCKEDLVSYRRILSLSNKYYNDGLMKAHVRDLSGAIVSLRKSLQLDKKNTNARNLLGLIYHEMGETIQALSEWVLSKNYQEENNEADYYIDLIQNNPSKLHNTNQTIKKYNYALSQAKSRNYDLAIIQLKKVISGQPHYIAAHQLLALLYMNQGENEKAAKCLRKAQKIDINNTVTLKYLSEIGVSPNAVRPDKETMRKNLTKNNVEEPQFFSPEPVIRDGKISKWSLIYLAIGLIVGILTVSFLVVPNMRKSISAEYNTQAIALGEEQTRMAAEILTLEDDKKDLQTTVKKLKAQIKKVEEEAVDETIYEKLFSGISKYIEKDMDGAAETLLKVDVSKFESKSAKSLYAMIQEKTFPNMSKKKYSEGYAFYTRGAYEDAVKTLKLTLKYDKSNVNAMYYLGRSYQRLNDTKNAKKYYSMIINDYPNGPRVSEATRRLEELKEE